MAAIRTEMFIESLSSVPVGRATRRSGSNKCMTGRRFQRGIYLTLTIDRRVHSIKEFESAFDLFE